MEFSGEIWDEPYQINNTAKPCGEMSEWILRIKIYDIPFLVVWPYCGTKQTSQQESLTPNMSVMNGSFFSGLEQKPPPKALRSPMGLYGKLSLVS